MGSQNKRLYNWAKDRGNKVIKTYNNGIRSKKENIFLSILIPNYGLSNSLARCINSISSQKDDCCFKFEVLVCDQSKQNEKKQVNDLITKFDFAELFFLSEPDVLIARKELLKRARGEYIFYIDSDDYIDFGFFNKIFESLKRNNLPDLLITSFIQENNGISIKNSDLTFINNTNILNYFYCSDLLNTLWRKIFKKKCFDEKDIINVHSTNGDDWIISYSIVKNSQTIVFDNELYGYHYCLNNFGLTHTMTIDRFKKSFILKETFPLFSVFFDEQIVYKSRMNKFLSFCLISYRANKQKSIIKEAFFFVRDDLVRKLKISHKAAVGLKHKILYFVLKNKLFFIFKLIIKFYAK